MKFKSNVTKIKLIDLYRLKNVYSNIDGFITVDLGCERGNNLTNYVIKVEAPESNVFLRILMVFGKMKN